MSDIAVTRKTQKQRVKEHLEAFGSITDLEAFNDYRIRRLAAVIFLLRNDDPPMDIETEWKKGKNKFGEKTRWGKYTLKKPEMKQGGLF